MWLKRGISFNGDVRPSSVQKSQSLNIKRADNISYESAEGKRRRKGGCFSFKEVSIEPETASSLKDVDSSKLKAEIRRWAKAVVAYARQVSARFSISKSSSGSSRRRRGSSNSSGGVIDHDHY